MAYTTIKKSSDYFNTKLYTGNGAAARGITGVGFQPDWVWVKARSAAYPHITWDSARTNKASLCTNTDAAEVTTTARTLTSFDSDGFTTPNVTGDIFNDSGTDFASWNWKAGTTAIPSGSTTDPLGVSINTTSGFGIYKITSPASGSYVLKHGLGKKPKMVIVKDLEASQKWMVWSDTFSNATDDYLQLNDIAAKATYSTCWGTMNTTDCTIAVGGTLDANNDHVVYVFADVQGYSKFGSYVGNGNADGTFVYTGFKPAFVVFKGDNASDWQLWDNKRDTFNPVEKALHPNQSATASTDQDIDFLSNGFKIRSIEAHLNGSGVNFIYMAFAEQPLVGDNPATAR